MPPNILPLKVNNDDNGILKLEDIQDFGGFIKNKDETIDNETIQQLLQKMDDLQNYSKREDKMAHQLSNLVFAKSGKIDY